MHTPRRRYDHRIRDAVVEGRELALIQKLAIPASTRRSWRRRGAAPVVALHSRDAELRAPRAGKAEPPFAAQNKATCNLGNQSVPKQKGRSSRLSALAVQAGQTVDLHYSWRIDEPVRVTRLFAHRHAWTPNFSAWIERATGGEPELVHQSFDWFDVPTYHYNSLSKNPAPNSTARTDGAASGVLELQTGDELHFNCHITFTDARAAEVKLPKTAQEIGTLTFANEAYTAEMCSLLGSTVNVQLPSSPEWSTRKLPSFAGL